MMHQKIYLGYKDNKLNLADCVAGEMVSVQLRKAVYNNEQMTISVILGNLPLNTVCKEEFRIVYINFISRLHAHSSSAIHIQWLILWCIFRCFNFFLFLFFINVRQHYLDQQSLTFLAPGTSFVEESFSTDLEAEGWFWNDSNALHLLYFWSMLLLIWQEVPLYSSEVGNPCFRLHVNRTWVTLMSLFYSWVILKSYVFL